MKRFLAIAFLACIQAHTLNYEVQFENEHVCVSRIVIEPKEEIGLHRDVMPQVVIGLQGGVITRLESDGKTVDVDFPTGKAVYRPVDPDNEFHRSVNASDSPIELIVVQIKNQE